MEAEAQSTAAAEGAAAQEQGRESRMSGVREPAVAGRFYEASPDRLTASLRECFLHQLGPGALPRVMTEGPGRITALVSPHAGYMFSGPAAAHGFGALAADGLPETVVILGPSHYAAERRAAVSLASGWRTPLGEVAVDVELGRALAAGCPLIVADESAHRGEHSIEVQVPFLQFVFGERTPKICPICVRSHPLSAPDQLISDANQMGQHLAQALGGRRAVVIASTDLSHQVPQAVAERMDGLVIEAMLKVSPDLLLRTVAEHEISMCGPVPVAIALCFCLARGGHEGELLRYYTSGDVIGERSAVVGYTSVALRRQVEPEATGSAPQPKS